MREDITVNSLPLVIFRDAMSGDSSTIHFYIDGDGTPWIQGSRVASDPTSRSKIILSLIAEDTTKSILVGRPCYYLAPRSRPQTCDEKWWTSHRYSPPVVAAMSSAINEQIQRFTPRKVRLIGYSGGGTLAMLITKRLNQKVDQVITVAANLDVDQWIALHQFSPLATSLNAENFPVLSPQLRQVHFVGREDKNVPGKITKAIASLQPNASVIEIKGYSHECCWLKEWASRLRQVTTNN